MKFAKLSLVLVLIIAVASLSGCFDDDVVTFEEQLAIDVDIIDTYLEENSIDAMNDESGLRYVIHEEGTGESPELMDDIRVSYTGSLLGETDVFDSNDDITFPLNRLIVGWQIGFQLLQVGDTATFYIPSGLAYGTTGSPGGIPPNSNLVFGVRLKSIE